MPVRVTADEAATRWVTGIGQAGDKIRQGVARVQQAPGQKAAAAADKWLARTQASLPKYRANVGRVTLAQWQQSMTDIGINRIAQGAQAKKDKYTRGIAAFLPYLSQGVAQIDRMPNTTLQDGIARATAMITWNYNYKRQS